MNLYDLSIGEDKMNQFLSIALKTHFERLKVGGEWWGMDRAGCKAACHLFYCRKVGYSSR